DVVPLTPGQLLDGHVPHHRRRHRAADPAHRTQAEPVPVAAGGGDPDGPGPGHRAAGPGQDHRCRRRQHAGRAGAGDRARRDPGQGAGGKRRGGKDRHHPDRRLRRAQHPVGAAADRLPGRHPAVLQCRLHHPGAAGLLAGATHRPADPAAGHPHRGLAEHHPLLPAATSGTGGAGECLRRGHGPHPAVRPGDGRAGGSDRRSLAFAPAEIHQPAAAGPVQRSGRWCARRAAGRAGLRGSQFLFLIAWSPVLLISVSVVADGLLPEVLVRTALLFLGNPTVALLLSTLLAFWFLGHRRGVGLETQTRWLNAAIGGIAVILLIITAGGVFKQVLVDSGVGATIAALAGQWQMPPLLFAWLATALLRVMIGSSTVAVITAAGVVGPLVESTGVSPELMVLAVGAGSVFGSYVNDSAFWMFKEFFGLSMAQTFRSW